MKVDWKGYNTLTGDAFRVPYEELTFSSDSETYQVSFRGVGNNGLKVNGTVFRFDSRKQQLLVRFGSGVSIEPGGDYEHALKIYDVDFKSLNDAAE